MVEALFVDCDSMDLSALSAFAEPKHAKSETLISIPPDIALIIYCWPDEEEKGITTVKNLRELCEFKDIPIIIAATKEQEEKANKALEVGANSIIQQPIKREKAFQILVSSLRPCGYDRSAQYDFIDPFVNAAIDVIKITSGTVPLFRDMYLKKDYKLLGNVSGLIRLSGEAEGVVAVTFRNPLAQRVVAEIIGVESKSLSNEDIRDGIGELANIITGYAKARLARTPFHFEISLPLVVEGNWKELQPEIEAPCVTIVYEIDGEPFAVQVCLSPSTIKT
ncbi:MAG: chemotaxis protein CheX [Planctomycetota bacterium]